MRRLALVLLPCAVAVLVHLWLARRPSSTATPPDNNTHSGTFFFFKFHLSTHEALLPPPSCDWLWVSLNEPCNFLPHLARRLVAYFVRSPPPPS